MRSSGEGKGVNQTFERTRRVIQDFGVGGRRYSWVVNRSVCARLSVRMRSSFGESRKIAKKSFSGVMRGKALAMVETTLLLSVKRIAMTPATWEILFDTPESLDLSNRVSNEYIGSTGTGGGAVAGFGGGDCATEGG